MSKLGFFLATPPMYLLTKGTGFLTVASLYGAQNGNQNARSTANVLTTTGLPASMALGLFTHALTKSGAAPKPLRAGLILSIAVAGYVNGLRAGGELVQEIEREKERESSYPDFRR